MSPIRRIRRLRKRTEEANAKRQRRRVLLESLEPRLLLSGETLSFSATAGASVDLLLQLDDATQQLQLIDKTDQTILKSKALANTTAVEITGADYDDKLTIDLSTPFSLSGGIKFTDAFSGDNDRLTIVGKDNVWNVTGQNAGNVDNAGIIEFLGIENLEGGSGNDVFHLDGGVVSGTIEGGGGNDTLHGPESDTTWNITGDNSGNVAGLDFSGIENLTGAADNEDTFVFQDGGSLSGSIDGGVGGYDTLVVDFSAIDHLIYDAYGPDSGVVNADGNVIEFVGLEPVTVSGTNDLIVNVNSSPEDLTLEVVGGTLRVNGSSIEDITTNLTVDTVTINFGSGADSLTIGDVTGFDLNKLTVNGGSGTDTIKITRDANMTLTDTGLSVGSDTVTLGSIEQAELTGGDSANTLDASAFTGDVTLRGGGDDDILKGGTGDDTLEGGAGNDTFIFADSWGTDSVNSGGGKDLLDFTGFSGNLSLNGSNTFSSGTNQLSQTGTAAETIDVVLSTAEQTELVTNGLNALISMLERLEGYNQLAATLPLISQTPDSGTTGATFGEIVGISETISKLQSEFNSFFAGSSTDKLSELVDYIDTFSATVLGSEISSILNLGNVSLSTPTDSVSSTYRAGSGGALELLIDFNLKGTQSSTFDLNLGSEAEAVGVVFDATIRPCRHIRFRPGIRARGGHRNA